MFSDIITTIERIKKFDHDKDLFLRVKPAVDIYETDHTLIVWAEMPNVDKKDLQVHIKNGILHIQGKRMSSFDNGQYLLRETSDVMYERFFELRENIDQDKIEASYQAGILKITLKKKEEAQPRKIEID
jgi:HSP20 family protein